MPRWSERAGLGALGAALLFLAAPAPPARSQSRAAAGAPGPVLARLAYVDRKAEQGTGAPWQEAREGTPLRIGERLRTAADGLLRLEFPWMAMTVSPSSSVAFPDGYLLAALLDEGRVVLEAEGREVLKLQTGEGEVRGQGRAVVRRHGTTTLVTALEGRFFVEGAGRTLALPAGTGAIVRPGQAPLGPLTLPPPPEGLSPGRDPVYAAPGEPVELRWKARQTAYQVEVLPVGSETVLLQRDVGAPTSLAIPWPGAFRWRVASRDEIGLEGRPSAEGLICVDE